MNKPYSSQQFGYGQLAFNEVDYSNVHWVTATYN